MENTLRFAFLSSTRYLCYIIYAHIECSVRRNFHQSPWLSYILLTTSCQKLSRHLQPIIATLHHSLCSVELFHFLAWIWQENADCRISNSFSSFLRCKISKTEDARGTFPGNWTRHLDAKWARERAIVPTLRERISNVPFSLLLLLSHRYLTVNM